MDDIRTDAVEDLEFILDYFERKYSDPVTAQARLSVIVTSLVLHHPESFPALQPRPPVRPHGAVTH